MLLTRANVWRLFPSQAHTRLSFWGSRDPFQGTVPPAAPLLQVQSRPPPFPPNYCCNETGRKVQQKGAEANPGTGEDGRFCGKLSPVCNEVRFWGPVLPSADTVGTQPRATLVTTTGRNILNATPGERTEAGGALGLSWDRVSTPQSYSPPHGTLEGKLP